jgi:hypothetical protein
MAYATLRYRHGSTALTSRSVQVLPARLIQIKCTTAYIAVDRVVTTSIDNETLTTRGFYP